MSEWVLVFLAVWLVGTGAGTALGILLVRGGSMRAAPLPPCVERDQRGQAA